MFVMINAEDLAAGRRTAVLLLVTPTDRWQDENQQWQPASALPVGTHVQAVDQPLTQAAPRVGEEMLVRSLITRRVYSFAVTDIHLARASDLTAGELLDLGHSSRESFARSLSGALGDRQVWFIRLLPAAASGARH